VDKANCRYFIEVDHIDDVDHQHLLELGYIFKHTSFLRRKFFQKDDRSVHLHVAEKDSFEARRHLNFQYFLQNNPQYAKKYSEEKLKIAPNGIEDRFKYLCDKQKIIKEIELASLKSYSHKTPSCYTGRSWSKEDIKLSLHHNLCLNMSYGSFFSKDAFIWPQKDQTLTSYIDLKDDTFNCVVNAHLENATQRDSQI
jgi:hypothetical protein